MTLTRAGRIAVRYPTIVTRTSDDSNGFSATLFKDASGNLTLAIRGTESDNPKYFEADAYILGAGAAYTQIVAMVKWWKKISSLESQVQNLVDAMAAFSPPPPGQETLPPDYAATLNPVIVANWQ